MGAMEVASLFASLKLDDKMTSPLKDAKKSLDSADKAATQAERSVGGLGSAMQGLGSVIASIGVIGFFGEAIAGAREAAAVNRQLDAVLESTSTSVIKVRDAHGKLVPMMKATRESVLATSEALMKKTGIDDDEITKAQSLLLTFTKIGKDVMPMATETVLDMAAAMGTDSKSAALMIGKALQSAEGVTALTRAGVSFTKQEQNKIKALFASGKAAEAQAMILAELNKEFGGSAAAQADGITRLQTGWGNFVETIGGVVLPIIDSVALVFNDLLTILTPFIPQIAAAVAGFAAFATVTGPIGAILGTILGPIGAIGLATAGMFVAWNTNFGGIQDIAANAWAAIKPGLDMISNGIKAMFNAFTTPDISGMQGGDMAADAMQALDTRSLGQRLSAAIQAGAPQIIEGFRILLQGAWEWLSTDGLKLIQDGMKAAVKFTDNIATFMINNAPDFVFGIEQWLGDAWKWVKSNLPDLLLNALKEGLGLIGDLTATIAAAAPDIGLSIGNWIRGGLTWLTTDAPKLIQSAISGLFAGKVSTTGMQGGDMAADLIPPPTVFEQLAQSGMDIMHNVFETGLGLIGGLFEGAFGLKEGTIKTFFDDFFGEMGPVNQAMIDGSKWVGNLITQIGKIGTAFTDAFKNVANMVTGVFREILKTVGELLMKAGEAGGAFAPLRDIGAALVNVSGMGSKGSYNPENNNLASLPHRAGGGNVVKGRSYVVGENGAEVLTAPFNGEIITNRSAFGGGGGGMGGSINISAVYISGTDNPAKFFDAMQAEAKRRNMTLGSAM